MHVPAQGDRLITIEETANLYGISRNHLMNGANQLTRAGCLKARQMNWTPLVEPWGVGFKV